MGKLSAAEQMQQQQMQLDNQFKDRQLAAELAMHAAEQEYLKQRMIWIDLAQTSADADQFAKSYALQISEFEYSKISAEREWGLSERTFNLQEEMDRARLSLEQNAEQFKQMVANKQLTFDESSITGFFNGQRTLAREKFDESTREFDLNYGLDRAKAVLDAPRGPADYVGYINRMRGTNNTSAEQPGVISNLFKGTGISGPNADYRQPVPTSNTQYALGMLQATDPRWGGQPLNTQSGSGTPLSNSTASQQPPQASQPSIFSGATATQGTNDPNVDAARRMISNMSNTSSTGDPTIKYGSDVNIQSWNKLSPIEQEYTKGLVEENGGQPGEDFEWSMKEAAPDFRQVAKSRSGY